MASAALRLRSDDRAQWPRWQHLIYSPLGLEVAVPEMPALRFSFLEDESDGRRNAGETAHKRGKAATPRSDDDAGQRLEGRIGPDRVEVGLGIDQIAKLGIQRNRLRQQQ